WLPGTARRELVYRQWLERSRRGPRPTPSPAPPSGRPLPPVGTARPALGRLAARTCTGPLHSLRRERVRSSFLCRSGTGLSQWPCAGFRSPGRSPEGLAANRIPLLLERGGLRTSVQPSDPGGPSPGAHLSLRTAQVAIRATLSRICDFLWSRHREFTHLL